jgi:DNA-binding MarR family transcriptional regulator
MQATAFMAKRAHRQSVAERQAVLDDVVHMTPARLDLLYTIRTEGRRPDLDLERPEEWTELALGTRLRQDTLRRVLALHPSTVSKMLVRLEELGWVVNEGPANDDGRTNVICLTANGVIALDEAMRRVLRAARRQRKPERLRLSA